MKRFLPLVVIFVFLTSVRATLQTVWAGQVPLPAGFTVNAETLIRHDFDEATFLVGAASAAKRGKYASGYLVRQPEGFHEPSDAAWKKWDPVLRAKGWVLKGHEGDSWSLQRVEGASESWLTVGLAEFQDPKLTLVQAPAAPRSIQLIAPAATPEKVGAATEFPFLKAAPGSTLENSALRDEPFDVSVPGIDREPHLVGRSYVVKQYTPPASFSKLEVELTYRDALTRAGWTVLVPRAGSPEGEGSVIAHWNKNGRDIWASIGRAADDSNTGFSIYVADVGAEDWTKALASSCRLPLYGVTFDFDKATLKPESTPILDKALAALNANMALAIEVQGHTDDVGDDAYNLKLSGQRADAVRTWFTQHGLPATRLTSKGYGKNQPVVENSSDANRARNRRVELSCRK